MPATIVAGIADRNDSEIRERLKVVGWRGSKIRLYQVLQGKKRFPRWRAKITCYYQDFDLINNKRISKLTSSCIISIFTGMLAREEVKDIVKLMRQERLCGTGSKCAARLIPSYALDGKGFCAERYWRGPFWVKISTGWYTMVCCKMVMIERLKSLGTKLSR